MDNLDIIYTSLKRWFEDSQTIVSIIVMSRPQHQLLSALLFLPELLDMRAMNSSGEFNSFEARQAMVPYPFPSF